MSVAKQLTLISWTVSFTSFPRGQTDAAWPRSQTNKQKASFYYELHGKHELCSMAEDLSAM